VKEFETKVATYLGVRSCIGVSSGTEALVLSLRALAIIIKGKEYFDPTDEILTSPFTFTATGDAILRSGATPVFVDIDPMTYNIDPPRIQEYISGQKKNGTRKVVGIIPIHLYGGSCAMDAIMRIAKENGLFVVEDTAQAFGGTWKGRKLGAIGTTGCFSFFPSKNLGGFGDGGMVATNDDSLAELLRMLLKHGGKDKYNVDHIGYNARLDTLQAAILLAKLKYVDEFNMRRKKIAEVYRRALSGIEPLALPIFPGKSEEAHVYHQFTLRAKHGKRSALQKHLMENGISSMIYYPLCLHAMKVFEERYKIAGSLVHSETAAKEVLSIPIEPLMENSMIMEVAAAIKSFYIQ
jgi:dTDP-4-amino-4,6-dideoxygalactose transaminase